MSYIDPAFWNISTELINSSGILWMQVPVQSVVFYPPEQFTIFLSIVGIGLLMLGILAGYEIRKKIEKRGK